MISWMNRNSVWFGLTIGIILPAAVYGILFLIYEWMDMIGVFTDVTFAEDFRTRTLTLVSICSNLLVMQFLRKSSFHHESTRGMLMATMILVIFWFFTFGIKILKF